MSLQFLEPGLGSEQIEYTEGWELQRRIHAQVVAAERPDTVILLEHQSVYTAGKRTEPAERPRDGAPVVDVDRGGKITWHGPGQLVGYPIVKLPEAVGVVDYVRRLEEALIDLMAGYGLATGRVPGRSGVWLPRSASRPERKIAAIGVRVAAGVTMHGFAVNVDPDLDWYGRIIPCGIRDAGVTSLAAETGERPGLTAVAERVRPLLERYLGFSSYVQSPPLVPASEQDAVTYGLTVGVR
jgi:lipoyl(octanoyl) transferase